MTLNIRIIPGIAIIFVQLFGAFFGALLSRSVLRSVTFVDAFSTLGIVDLPNQYPPVDELDNLHFSNRFQVSLSHSSNSTSEKLQVSDIFNGFATFIVDCVCLHFHFDQFPHRLHRNFVRSGSSRDCLHLDASHRTSKQFRPLIGQ